ncbi:MAG: hypothetical protein J6V90_01405 [Treponema sp.]|nr:hypothetical protein [Treponema sp.]
MKKLIGALALAAMVATSAFAEVSFGAWVCNLPSLISSNGDGIQGGGVSNPWGGWRPARADISFTSDDGKAGMVLGVYTGLNGNNPGSGNGGSIGNADNTLMWVKPIEQIRLSVGALDNWFGTRSDLCFGSWNWLRPEATTDGVRWGEGITFSATSGWDMAGLGVEIMPIEALKIFAFVPLKTSVSDIEYVFGNGWYGAMYTIDGIGKIKAQFIGKYAKTGDKSKLGTIEAAFDLTAVDKLFATVGIEFNIQDNDLYKKGDKMFGAALGASYGITEAFKVSADFSVSIPKEGDLGMAFGVGLDYALNDALGLTADVRMIMPNNSKDPTLSFLAGATYAVGSNGSLGLGFQAAVAMGDAPANKTQIKYVEAAADKKFIFAVPLRFSTWF